jgi:hypothetical protein
MPPETLKKQLQRRLWMYIKAQPKSIGKKLCKPLKSRLG